MHHRSAHARLHSFPSVPAIDFTTIPTPRALQSFARGGVRSRTHACGRLHAHCVQFENPQVWSIANRTCIATLIATREHVRKLSLRGPSGGYASVRGIAASPLGYIATATHGNWADSANRLLVWWPGNGGATRLDDARRAVETVREETERVTREAEVAAKAARLVEAQKQAAAKEAREAEWQAMVRAAEESKAQREARGAVAQAKATRTTLSLRGTVARGGAVDAGGFKTGSPSVNIDENQEQVLASARHAVGMVDGQLISLSSSARVHDWRTSGSAREPHHMSTADLQSSTAQRLSNRRLERGRSRSMTLNRVLRRSQGAIQGASPDDLYLVTTIDSSHAAARALRHESGAATAAPSLQPLPLAPPSASSQAWVHRLKIGEVSCSAQFTAECGFTADCLACDGDTLVCIGGDGSPNSVSVYNASVGEVVRNLSGHTDRVACVACDGDVIASSGRDKTIRLWSRASGACTASIGSGDEVVYGLALRGRMMLSGEGLSKYSRLRAKAKLWQIGEAGDTAHCIATYAEHTKHICSVALHDRLALTASHDATVCVWPLNAIEGQTTVGHTPSMAKLEHPSGICFGA